MKKKFNIFLIVLLTIVAVIGGSLIAIMIYLQSNKMLDIAIQTVFNYITLGASSTLVIFWGLLLPIILIAFLIFTLIRFKKVGKVVEPYENGIKAAVEIERKAIMEREQKQVERFGFYNESDDEPVHDDIDSLKELCERFRAFSSANLNLHFSESEVREFVSGLATSHLIILQGASGSGKTSLAFAFGEFIANPSTIIPVQPMWKERADLIGYYNEFTKKYNDTPLFRKMYEANGSNKIFITVLDEMNIARVEYYFAEFLSLMEIPNPELRYLEVVSDKYESDPEKLKDGSIKLPENMWFVGTVNNDDSAFAISDKVYDRAMIMNLSAKATRNECDRQNTARISFGKFSELIQAAQKDHRMSDADAARLQKLDDFLADKLKLTYGNRIRKQINEFISAYVSCGGEALEALDTIMARKVLFKISYKDVSKYQNEIEALENFIENTFGKGKMPNCISLLEDIRSYE